eukprot:TRINITY_DN6741_c0_g1_i3.p1 TRINITY_DN6741_c0_g1~~TRINITY_DN6741_c0_g1_i3.p1  ORF type:complete len:564 (+),score=67.78 TRINITY_DN6741_c0_g1_i3:229-1920(+)
MLAPPEDGDTTLFQLPSTEIVSVPSADERGRTRQITQGLQCEGVSSDAQGFQDFSRRYGMLDLRGSSHPRTRPIPSLARFVLDRSEPTALGGLEQIYRLTERFVRGTASLLPSWLPRWDGELGKRDGCLQLREQLRSKKQAGALEVSASCWHPDKNLLALAVWRKVPGADGVREEEHVLVYEFESSSLLKDSETIVLRDAQQVGIKCMQWAPNRRNVLAVGCKHGTVCQWTITRGQTDYGSVEIPEPGRSVGVQPQRSVTSLDMPSKPVVSSDSSMAEVSAWVNLLDAGMGEGWESVDTLSFSPDGWLLAVGCVSDANLVVWDLALEIPTVLRSIAAGNSLVAWSPSGHFLFAATTAPTITIWETHTFSCKQVSGLAHPCKSACWGAAKNGMETVVMSLEGGHQIHALHLTAPAPHIDVTHYIVQDTGPYSVQGGTAAHISLMGPIRQLAWDDSAQRLAVIFESQPHAREASGMVALYGVDLSQVPVLLQPHGFLRPAPCTPQLGNIQDVSFAHVFRTSASQHSDLRPKFGDLNSSSQAPPGALLTACWAEGCFTFWPLYLQS